jgi:hypothetical protein
MGKVSEWIQRYYNAITSSVANAVIINAVTATRITTNDPNRFAVTIANLGAAVVYIGFDANVGVLNGFYLAANGGTIGFNARDDQELPTREMWCIGAGASTVYVFETVAVG